MVSRIVFISVAISLLSTTTFAQHQANPLVNDNGDSIQFGAAKRNVLGGLLSGVPDLSDHRKQAVSPQPNAPAAPASPNQQLPAQSNAGFTPTDQNDPDEQAGDKFDAGDDKPDTPGGHEAKRSLARSLYNKPNAPESITAPFVARRAAQPDSEADDEDLPDDEDREGGEEEEDASESNTPEAKRELVARIRLITKRNMDSFLFKTQFMVDRVVDKTGKFADKIGGGDDDTKSSGSDDSVDTKNAEDAVDRAKSLSSAARNGDMKALHDSQ